MRGELNLFRHTASIACGLRSWYSTYFQNCGRNATQCTLENEGKVEEKPQKSETKCYRCFIADLPLVTSALAQTYLLVAIYPKLSVQTYLFKAICSKLALSPSDLPATAGLSVFRPLGC